MNKNAKWPNRQTQVNPAGIGTKSKVFYFWDGGLVVIRHCLAAVLTTNFWNANYNFFHANSNYLDIDFHITYDAKLCTRV
jgi:hypothetical protein